ncbi:MAG: transporter substrate-binding domain-containing protein [bacterium]|nr:transporter substrate-binding domain-containing protein [bacterium]
MKKMMMLSPRQRLLTLGVCLFLIPLVLLAIPGVTGSQDARTDLNVRSFETRTSDFDEMLEQLLIRVLVVYSKTFYFLDSAQQRGISYDVLMEFEKFINEQLQLKTRQIRMVFLPVQRDELLPLLVEGKGDIAVANLTITPERQQVVDFSDPTMTGVSEILVTGPSAPPMHMLDDLAGKEIYVRFSSSYYEHLRALNSSFKQAGKPEMILKAADEYLEDEDLLEMVNAGLLPIIVMDSHKAEFWAGIFDKITLHPEIAVNTGGQIAWAFRKNSPKLKEMVNTFVKDNKKGTMMGNILLKRYLKDNKWVRNAASEEELKKFRATLEFFRKYADQYGFSYLAVAAQGYQESRLDQSVRSSAGAVGVMQLLPSTAADPSVGIPNIEEVEPNIHAGIKYLKYIYERYFQDAEMDDLNKAFFSFASYNAGPARIAKLRKQAAERGLDPNVWFRNVELIVAEDIGRETVQYVSNIFKYYLAYKLVIEQGAKKKAKLPQKARVEEKISDPVTAPKALSQALILSMQERLTKLGYTPGPADGKWGKKTETALKQFQQDQGLAVTGKLDEETKKTLEL